MKNLVGAVIAIAIAFLMLALMFAPAWNNVNLIGLIGLRGFLMCVAVLAEIGAAYLVTNWEKL